MREKNVDNFWIRFWSNFWRAKKKKMIKDEELARVYIFLSPVPRRNCISKDWLVSLKIVLVYLDPSWLQKMYTTRHSHFHRSTVNRELFFTLNLGKFSLSTTSIEIGKRERHSNNKKGCSGTSGQRDAASRPHKRIRILLAFPGCWSDAAFFSTKGEVVENCYREWVRIAFWRNSEVSF